MRLAVLAIGRVKAGPDRELADRYCERAAKAGRALGFKSIDIVELPESRAQRAAERIAEEGAALTKHLAGGAAVVALDETGAAITSESFAAQLGKWRDGGREGIYFIIGGADGLVPEIRQRADLTLSFGKVTWPHQLVRIMLLEQLYRAITILSGHPYHRA
jgi:23S rRNA (pseudouridine1915-N3)-methyltransferase